MVERRLQGGRGAQREVGNEEAKRQGNKTQSPTLRNSLWQREQKKFGVEGFRSPGKPFLSELQGGAPLCCPCMKVCNTQLSHPVNSTPVSNLMQLKALKITAGVRSKEGPH